MSTSKTRFRGQFNPFNYSEVKQLFITLLTTLPDESGRGAILIATSHVEDHLTKLIEAVIPETVSRKNKKRLFSYPGNLSSFSSKIELAYIFRLINKNLYNSLNALRKLRNKAAHNSSKFELLELNEELKSIYELGPGLSILIRQVCNQIIVDQKSDQIRSLLISEPTLSIADKKKIFEEIFSKTENIEIMEKQVPYLEMAFGLSFLCGLIVYNKIKIIKLTNDIKVFSDLLID